MQDLIPSDSSNLGKCFCYMLKIDPYSFASNTERIQANLITSISPEISDF